MKVSIVGSLRDREVTCSASDRQGSNFESCVWRTVSSQSSHHPQEVLLAQVSLYVHKGGLKPDSFNLAVGLSGVTRFFNNLYVFEPTNFFSPHILHRLPASSIPDALCMTRNLLSHHQTHQSCRLLWTFCSL